jgi:hypothetical protein
MKQGQIKDIRCESLHLKTLIQGTSAGKLQEKVAIWDERSNGKITKLK